MTNNHRSYNLEEILAGYVLGDLDEVELVWLNEQLAANPQLREQVTQLESSLNLMPYGLPKDVPENNLRSQILSQAQPQPNTVRLKKVFGLEKQGKQGEQGNRNSAYPKSIEPQPVSSQYNWSWIISAVTAVGALLLSINNFSLRQQIAFSENRLQQQQELISLLRQPNNRLVALGANDDVVAASGSLFISPESNTAVLTLKNLDSLPGKQVYRLWAISQGKKIGCSNFTPNAQGEVHLDLSLDEALVNASSVSITIEPEPDTEQPLGQELLSGSYSAI